MRVRRLALVAGAGAACLALLAPAAVGVPPTLRVADGDLVVEATSRAGAIVGYAIAADDPATAIGCNPPPGTTFPLGQTTVTCVGRNPSTGEAGILTFIVTVRDTTPPEFDSIPQSVLKIVNGVAKVAVNYTAPVARDLVNGIVQPTCTPKSGSVLKLGTRTVRCTAVDAAGNSASVMFVVRVVDPIPPANVTNVAAKPAGNAVAISWQPPSNDYAGVEVRRSPGVGTEATSVVYRGGGTSFTDKNVKNGSRYSYVVATFDPAGNTAKGVTVAVGSLRGLISPLNAAKLTAPPLLEWTPVEGAAYYNVQLFRDGKKILSIWPTISRLRLTSSWVFGGVRYTLSPGPYAWYVWPGFGPLAQARYCDQIGSSTFVILR